MTRGDLNQQLARRHGAVFEVEATAVPPSTLDAAIVIATAAHREGIAARLEARGVDLGRIGHQGRYRALDAAETLDRLLEDGHPDEGRVEAVLGGLIEAAARAAGGRRPVAVFGEMVALLAAAGRHDAALALEHGWNALARRHAFVLRCVYPISAFTRAEDGAALAAICDAHTGVVPLESYTALGDDNERLRMVALLQQKAAALATEVAERQRADRELVERNRELHAAVAARDAFLSVAAHELRTPVTGLRGYTQLLLRDLDRGRHIAPERLAAALAAIERQTGQINHLVMRLLDAAQIEAGKLRIAPVPTDLAALVQATLAERPISDTHVLVYDGPDHLETLVDPVRLEQVLAILLDNAVKYSPDGGTIEVALRRDEAGGVELAVTDAGIGIPPGQREAVFTRFHQPPGRPSAGLGLGLSISRQIIELHGGTVRIADPDHPGTRVVIALPPVPSPNGPPAA
jgi:signal transduction histidine kinase